MGQSCFYQLVFKIIFQWFGWNPSIVDRREVWYTSKWIDYHISNSNAWYKYFFQRFVSGLLGMIVSEKVTQKSLKVKSLWKYVYAHLCNLAMILETSHFSQTKHHLHNSKPLYWRALNRLRKFSKSRLFFQTESSPWAIVNTVLIVSFYRTKW